MRNTRLVGHELKREGGAYDSKGVPLYGRRQTGRGKCSCGATSDVLQSNYARKRWHTGHKDKIRGGAAS